RERPPWRSTQRRNATASVPDKASPMAGVAGDLRFDLVLLDQLLAERELVRVELVATGVLLVPEAPRHVVDLFARPDVLLRGAVAVQAPLHQQRLLLPDQRHVVHAPVAGDAADALLHMDAVIEVTEVTQVVDAVPGDGGVVAVALADRLEHLAANPD